MARQARPNAKPRSRVSLRVKLEICHVAFANPKWGPTEIAKKVSEKFAREFEDPEFEISRFVVHNALKQKEKLFALEDKHFSRTSLPSTILCILDVILKRWILSIVMTPPSPDPRVFRRPLRCAVVAKYAREKIAELINQLYPPEKRPDVPKITRSWVSRFLKRNGLNFRKLFGEAGSVWKALVGEVRKKIQSITQHYHPDDIYNFDESAYFYRKISQWTIAPVNTFLPGFKMDKSRVTMAVGTNASGTHRFPLLILGTADVPIPFRNQSNRVHWVGDKSRQPLAPDFHYAQTKKGWMTSEVFKAWLAELDQTMRISNRHILLLVDNVSSHKIGDLVLTNIRLEYLPKNTTSFLQPMDQGIIKATKDGIYNRRDDWEYSFYRLGIYNFEKVDLFTACQWCAAAFNSLSQHTIRNAWRKANTIPNRSNMSFLAN